MCVCYLDGVEPLAPECLVELKEVRRSLLEDYEISPEVASACRDEIEHQCKGIVRRQTVHCLMDLARPSKRPSQKRASNKCVEEVGDVFTMFSFHEVILSQYQLYIIAG